METYYNEQVRDIISNIINELWSNPERKAVWAETCFLEMFYNECHQHNKRMLKELIKNGQLEIVGGGWV